MARASVFDNREKGAIVRRALMGAIEAGARDFVYLADSHNIVGSAVTEFEGDCDARPLEDVEITATAADTECAARRMKEAGCAVVLVLGGDGTSRAFARGWRDAPVIALSTGTNNVFPVFAEATTAGAAAGLIAAGTVAAGEVRRQCKIVDVEIEDEAPDIALIDAVASSERFVGARALLDAAALRCAILTRAESDAVGMSALGGLLQPISDGEDAGLYLGFGAGETEINAPLAPGYFRPVGIREIRKLDFDDRIEIEGPCVLAFDGERDRVLDDGQHAVFHLSRGGPGVIGIAGTLRAGASRGAFTTTGVKHAD